MDPGTDVDNILKTLGRFGKYQIIQMALLTLFVLQNSFHLVSAVYIGYRPTHRCEDINTTLYLQEHNLTDTPSDVKIQYKQCEIKIDINYTGIQYHYTESCLNGYRYSIPTDRSTVTEWNLVCEGAERSEFSQTLIMLGQATGAAIFSPLSDRFGRKKCNCAARLLYFITALATVFAPNIASFSIFRLLQGTFQGGSVMTCTVLFIELLPKEVRHRENALGSTAWTTGIVLTTFIGYLCRNLSWRYMQLILALMTVNTLIDWIFLDESLRWLIANGKHEQIEKQLRNACRMNNVNYETVVENVRLSSSINVEMNENSNGNEREVSQVTGSETHTSKVEKYSALTVLRHRRILMASMILWIAWITNTLTYYGLMLTASKLSGDRYLNNILSSLAEYPAVIVQQLLVNRIGRRFVLILFHGIAGVSLVLATVCNMYGDEYYWLPYLGTLFSFIGRFAISGSFSTVFMYTPEVYPTNLRNVGLGMASTVSRAGSMLSPFAITLAEYIPWGPAVVFAVMNVIVTLSLLLLPETMGRELPTTISELKTWYKHKKPDAK